MTEISETEIVMAAVNSLTSHVVVIDREGRIVFANEAWRAFGAANGASDTEWTGWNYLDVCLGAAEAGNPDGAVVADALTQVMEGRTRQRLIEYECSSPTEQRYSLLTIRALPIGGNPHALIMHEDITVRRLAERKLAVRV